MLQLSESLLGISVCPGRYLASSTVASHNYFESRVDNDLDAQIWLTIASVLATFNIHKSKDDTGSEEEVEAAYSDGASRCLPIFYFFWTMLIIALNSHPDFKCTVRPRSDEAIKLIQECD